MLMVRLVSRDQRIVQIMIIITLYFARILIIQSCELKIHLYHNLHILHLCYMMLLLNHFRNHTWQDLLRNVIFSLSLCLLNSRVWKISLACLGIVMCINTIIHPQSVLHVLSCCIFICEFSLFECFGIHRFIFLIF